jgi:hypothetical protein
MDAADWRALGLSADYIEPGVYELWEELLGICGKKTWSRYRQSLPRPPRNEDEGVDFLMGMTVAEVVEVFAPLVRKPK